ncbi:hypothetical protein BRD00_09160 [Halobacteriales archaeon QS_8_69_26]|nr:MAG: hypothetical protein BRD00_09160 [Halobacteriales archaeon QS_8_69_26]
MKRREFLGSIAAAAGTGALAGCLSSPGGGGDDGDDGDGGGGGSPSVSDRSIETTDAACGSGGDASVSYEDESVLVRGSLSASDPCHHAELKSAEYDAGSDTLTVSVAAVENEDADMCSQCVAAVDYEARIEFDGGLPGSVVVEHDGQEVTTGSR